MGPGPQLVLTHFAHMNLPCFVGQILEFSPSCPFDQTLDLLVWPTKGDHQIFPILICIPSSKFSLK